MAEYRRSSESSEWKSWVLAAATGALATIGTMVYSSLDHRIKTLEATVQDVVQRLSKVEEFKDRTLEDHKELRRRIMEHQPF